jgi:hypothetical protein
MEFMDKIYVLMAKSKLGCFPVLASFNKEELEKLRKVSESLEEVLGTKITSYEVLEVRLTEPVPVEK